MSRAKGSSTTQKFEAAAGRHAQGYVLRLYVAGASGRSTRALTAIKAICERYLKDEYHLDVIDLHQQPEQAAAAQILAAPTLIKERPGPLRRLVGDLSDEERVLSGLGLAKAF